MSMQTPGRRFPPFDAEDAILAIIEGFRTRTLPIAAWTHQAHLAVGLWHVARFGETEAQALLRDGIRSYNEAVGTPNNDMRGYHETVTLYYSWAAARYLETAPALPLVDRVNGFVESRLGSKDGIFMFWSRDLLLSVDARRAWIAPDLMPLDVAALKAMAVD
ncbi:hypothetical protein [Phreatobacter stygius]|uniref:Uncharacterized protein n=1 Tax=Phreatobacter stygius TaxID=1940610 RepID=A0A4D7B7W3_9HYPH|nr:hypothetical protein [Phreatobacter stygius]QCI65716.1 hypothetical protein E8M01_16765 [Phreatobacter stygius]